MRLSCTVCRELLIPSDHVHVAPCGHYLHYLCWVNWLERSKTCPQCRTKTTTKQLVKLFFNVADSDTAEPDAATLTNKIDSLTFEIQCKNKDVENAKELYKKQKNQNDGLREEVKKYRDEIEKIEASNTNLQGRVRYLQQQARVADEKKQEVEKLRSKLERLENLEIVMKGSSSEVERILGTITCSPEGMRSLALFSGSLKKALEDSKEARKRLRDSLNSERAESHSLRQEVRNLKADLDAAQASNRRLTEEVAQFQDERNHLNKKIRDLEAAIVSPTTSSVTHKALRRLIAESPAPALKRTSDSVYYDDMLPSQETPVRVGPARSVDEAGASSSEIKVPDTDDSPIFGIKPKVVKESDIRRPLVSASNISIFSNRLQSSKAAPPVLNTSIMSGGYDGMGGHSKCEEFPQPKPDVKKLKLLSKAPKKKLSAPAGVPKLSEFKGFLDLG